MHDKNEEVRKVCDNTLDIISVSFSPYGLVNDNTRNQRRDPFVSLVAENLNLFGISTKFTTQRQICKSWISA